MERSCRDHELLGHRIAVAKSTVVAVTCILLAPPPTSVAGDNEINREALVQLIEAAWANRGYTDASFEYEGKAVYPRSGGRDRPEIPAFAYNGTYSMRSDGATRANIYFFDFIDQAAENYVVARLGAQTTVWSKRAEAREASITISEARPTDFQRIGSFGQIMLSDEVVELAQSTLPYQFMGFEMFDGARCAVARFYRSKGSIDKRNAISDTFWIDLERGGHVLRHEHRLGENLARILTGIRLEAHEASPGRSVWMPVFGQEEGHIGQDERDPSVRTYPKDAVYLEAYELVTATLRFDRGLSDEYFTVKPHRGDLVSDRLKEAEYEYGQYVIRSRQPAEPPPSDAEIEAGLEAMLKDSDFLARELKATSVARLGPTWADWAPWLVVGCAAAALAVILFRRRIAA